MISFSKSVYMIGFLASMGVTSQISDCFGRLPTIVRCYLMLAVSAFITNFSSSYLMFVIVRFFLAFGRSGLTTTNYILLMEITGPEQRTQIAIFIQFGLSLGIMTLPAVAWFVRHWFWQQLITMVPVVPLVYILWIIPESPRWLLTQKKAKKFVDVLENAAKKNKNHFDKEVVAQLLSPDLKNNNESTRKTFLDLLKTPEINKRALAIAFIWTVNAFIMYSVTYNTNDFGGDPYLTLFLVGFTDLLGRIFVFFIGVKLGRRKLLVVDMAVLGLTFAAVSAVPYRLSWLRISIFVVTKFCNAIAFTVLYFYTAELFPTVVRGVAMGVASICARLSAILAPFSRELDKMTNFSASSVICAALGVSSAFIASLLPETHRRIFPDTLEEGKKLTKCQDALKTEIEFSPQILERNC